MDPRIELLPKKPGVYIMRSREGTVIYVGKAKNLADRVKQYFQDSTSIPAGGSCPACCR